MKTNAIILALSLVLALTGKNIAGRRPPETSSNYVVIGAFSVKEHAVTWAESAKRINLQAEFEINPTRKLYYVYVLETGDKTEAVSQAKKIRLETSFNDTWVYTGTLGGDGTTKGIDINPVTEENLTTVELAGKVEVERQLDVIVEAPPMLESSEEKKEDEQGGKGFIFNISFEGATLPGEVEIIDGVRLTKVATYDANKRVYIRQLNKSGKMEARCQVFGYRRAQVDFNYNEPETTEGISLDNGNVVVPFELVKLRKGDFAIMYNVFFYKDAAIMRPESQYEVSTLLSMMNANPRLKIRLHGHTNGGAAGKIIKMGEKKNFFSLSGSKEGFGSAKALSEERASIIREYMIAEGIDEGRVQLKSWGGKKPIHDKKSNKAHENVRVEVEILEE